MQIRPEQARAFEEHAAQSFEERMLAHIRANLPSEYGALGESGARRAIADGIREAEGHGMVSERDVCVFIDTMLSGATAPWAAEILNDDLLSGPQKSRLIQEEARRHESAAPIAQAHKQAAAEFSSSKGTGEATQGCPAETWIGILVRDLEGTPVPRQDVRVVLDSGQVLAGTTNARGYVRFEGVESGAGEVTAISIPEEAELESGADSSEEARASRAAPAASEAVPETREESPLLEPLEPADEVFPDEEV